MFKLKADWEPAGDQPEAIKQLNEGLEKGLDKQTLLGVTGSGKTFTIANIIEKQQRPTLVIAHNKTLAAQLCHEFRSFFPDSAVSYFVSYYDYYQPEAYMPRSDTYIEKEAQINDEIDRLRHVATQAILSRRDVIIVASVSCIYNLGSSKQYESQVWHIKLGDQIDRQTFLRRLIHLFYQRTTADVERGKFRARGDVIEMMPISEKSFMYRFVFDGDTLTQVFALDPVTRKIKEELKDVWIFPAKHYVVDADATERAVKSIEHELKQRLKELEGKGKLLEVERLKRRTRYDIQMIKNVGYCSGIENYSSIFEGRAPGEPPHTLMSYFPEDFLTIVDESHVTIPQVRGMYFGDKARKENLVEHGFRLPSAKDNRPLQFEEFEKTIGQSIFVSATPGPYEYEHSEKIVEQIVRPTGLTDPEITILPVTETKDNKSQVDDLMERVQDRVDKNERVLVTTLTKKMAEDLTKYIEDLDIKVQYIHSDVKTMDRVEILSDLRKGVYDVLVGVNLLREGLDLPEVTLVAILDADKEGFLRSETSLVQTIGRAARHVNGEVVLYADKMTGSLTRAVEETDRRRAIQEAHNKKHGITPESIKKEIGDIREIFEDQKEKDTKDILKIEMIAEPHEIKKVIKEKRAEMKRAAANEMYETAALLRDEITVLEKELLDK
ncbi:excinuclease ABC subunit UvrB [Candidatus Uhrbacteria bacterium]|jgi:excinuclease ABC subunit B|nr:excinuclease ABC subunit UvrB [Candidatus Uhrbacteria bacterium]